MGFGIYYHLVIVLLLSLYTRFTLARPAHDSLESRQENNIDNVANSTSLVYNDSSTPTGIHLKYCTHRCNLWKREVD